MVSFLPASHHGKTPGLRIVETAGSRLYNQAMTSKRKNASDLLSPELVEELARPSDFRYGQAIFDRHGVEFIEFTDSKIEAWVGGLDGSVAEGGGQRRRTQLFVAPKGLAWHCAGNPRNHQIFCKHCVALALAILERFVLHDR